MGRTFMPVTTAYFAVFGGPRDSQQHHDDAYEARTNREISPVAYFLQR